MSFLILLSPSKTQELGETSGIHSLPEFLDKTAQLVAELQEYTESELAALMAISDKLAATTYQRFKAFVFPPHPGNCREALLTFRGDVFSEIEADNYTRDDLSYAQARLRILSGLYGILRPLDLIQPYRLEMGGKFHPHSATSLYTFWRRAVTNSINRSLKEIPNGTLVNLASFEYFKVVDLAQLQGPVVDVSFKQKKGDTLRTIAIHAKKARGALANFIIANRIEDIKDLETFTINSYSFAADLSTAGELVYIRQE